MSIKDELNDLREEVNTYVNAPSSSKVTSGANSINTVFSPSGNGKNIYLVFKHKVYGYKIIKKGFAWPAFFFGIIWAGVKKMWGMLLVLFISIFIFTIVLSIVCEGVGLRGVEINILLIPANIPSVIRCIASPNATAIPHKCSGSSISPNFPSRAILVIK